MGPFVLVLSYGSTKPIEIVQNLQAVKSNSSNFNTSQNIKIGESTFPAYNYSIKNKYFETIVKLIPFEGPINTIPVEILKETEAVLVDFDSTDKSFLIHIPKLCELIEKNNVELGLLITTELKDDCNEGLTYANIKEACTTSFDVIETINKDDDETVNKTSGNNQQNYNEVIEALENHVWSNVASSSGSKKENTESAAADDDLDEQQLEAYENLLTNIVNFKSNSANLNRDQILDQAEKLAEMFSNFMGDN